MSSHNYEVRVEGDLEALADLDELAVVESVEHEVTTVLSGSFENAEELSDILRRLRAFGLEVIEIRRVSEGEEPATDEQLGASAPTSDPDDDG